MPDEGGVGTAAVMEKLPSVSEAPGGLGKETFKASDLAPTLDLPAPEFAASIEHGDIYDVAKVPDNAFSEAAIAPNQEIANDTLGVTPEIQPTVTPDSPPPAGPYVDRNKGNHNADNTPAGQPSPGSAETQAGTTPTGEEAPADKSATEPGTNLPGEPPSEPPAPPDGTPEPSDEDPNDDAEAQAAQMNAAEAEVNKTTTDAERQKRIDEINAEIKNGDFTHKDELNELTQKAKDESDLQRLEGIKYSDMSKEDQARYEELKAKDKNPEPELTPEQQAEKRDKELEDLGTELMTKLANGEEITQEEEDRLQKLLAEKKMQEAGFTPEQAREAAKKGLELNNGRSEKGSKRTQEAKERIQELMSLELQLISQRNLAKKLSDERKTAIEDAKKAHDEAEKAEPQDRLRKKGIEYGKYMVVANYSAQIEGTRYMAQRVDARRKDLEQEVRRKLEVTGGLRALAEWGGAKINNVLTEIDIMAEEKLPFGMGVANGEVQRGRLQSSGRM